MQSVKHILQTAFCDRLWRQNSLVKELCCSLKWNDKLHHGVLHLDILEEIWCFVVPTQPTVEACKLPETVFSPFLPAILAKAELIN